MRTLKMSGKEVNQIGIFEKLRNKEMKQKEAAKILGLSDRQIRRKLKRFRRLGPESLIHGLRDKPSNNLLDPKLLEKALSLVKKKYPDFGPTFASDKLSEIDNIVIHPETLRIKMAGKGLWRIKGRKTSHREWRERKECFGELVQSDGSNHPWFEDRGSRCDLLAFIDDATSKVIHLEFAPESTFGYMRATKKYIEQHGLPHKLYVDRGKVFKVNLNNPDNERLTQYGRAMEELGVGITYARSPQAKGRVERLFSTLQDRLVKELRLRDISTIEEANKFLQEEYLDDHNRRFSVAPKSDTNLHRSFEGYDLDDIFVIKEERILTSDFTVRYGNKWFQFEKKQTTILFPGDRITVVTKLDGKTEFMIRSIKLCFHEIDKLVKVVKLKPRLKEGKPWVPPADHPWRKFNIKGKQKEDISTLEKADILTLV